MKTHVVRSDFKLRARQESFGLKNLKLSHFVKKKFLKLTKVSEICDLSFEQTFSSSQVKVLKLLVVRKFRRKSRWGFGGKVFRKLLSHLFDFGLELRC